MCQCNVLIYLQRTYNRCSELTLIIYDCKAINLYHVTKHFFVLFFGLFVFLKQWYYAFFIKCRSV